LSQSFSPVHISAIALYRLVSILAEAAGAGLAWLDENIFSFFPVLVLSTPAQMKVTNMDQENRQGNSDSTCCSKAAGVDSAWRSGGQIWMHRNDPEVIAHLKPKTLTPLP